VRGCYTTVSGRVILEKAQLDSPKEGPPPPSILGLYLKLRYLLVACSGAPPDRLFRRSQLFVHQHHCLLRFPRRTSLGVLSATSKVIEQTALSALCPRTAFRVIEILQRRLLSTPVSIVPLIVQAIHRAHPTRITTLCPRHIIGICIIRLANTPKRCCVAGIPRSCTFAYYPKPRWCVLFTLLGRLQLRLTCTIRVDRELVSYFGVKKHTSEIERVKAPQARNSDQLYV
jgi:hypothetical protein